MSVSFDGVKVGDRVRLTAERGEDATIWVRTIAASRTWITGATPRTEYRARDWDTVEVLSPPKPPLPTVPGLYVSKDEWVSYATSSVDMYILRDADSRLEWSSDRFGNWRVVDEADVPADLVRLVPEGEPSGLLEAARDARDLTEPGRWSIGSVRRAHRVLSDAIEKAEAQS